MSDLDKYVSASYTTPEELRAAKFAVMSVFGREPADSGGGGLFVTDQEWALTFAYKALRDMGIEVQQAFSILRFFRPEIEAWDTKTPLILSLNDGRYAVMITEPENRRIYDYRADVDRTHPAQAIPLPVPVTQASVNLSRAFELER